MKISTLYRKIKKYKERDRSKLCINPFYEWNILLIFGVFLSILVVFFYYKTFNDVYVNRFKEESMGSLKKDPYKTKEIKTKISDAFQYYEEKEKEHNDLLEKQPVFENVLNIKTSTSSVKQTKQTEQVNQNKKSDEEIKDGNKSTSIELKI